MTTIHVASEGSEQPDGRVQVLERVGLIGGPLVVQLVEGRPRPHLKPGTACVWLGPAQARDLGRELLGGAAFTEAEVREAIRREYESWARVITHPDAADEVVARLREIQAERGR